MLHEREERAAIAGSLEESEQLDSMGAVTVKLSPGPGRTPAYVAASQRSRIHAAMIDIAGREGYRAVTVRALARQAGVSSRAFYQRFASKEDCFLRTHEAIVRRAAKRIVASQAGESQWEKRLELAFRGFTRELRREPTAARLVLIEAEGAGEVGQRQARWASRFFAAMLAESFPRAPEQSDGRSTLLDLVLVEGIASVARYRLRWEEECGADLGDELSVWARHCRNIRLDETDQFAPPPIAPRPSSSKAGNEARPAFHGRDLILSAAAKLAAEENRRPLSAARVRTAAGISRKAFEAEFATVEDCLVTAAESAARDLCTRAREAKALAGSPREGVELAIWTLCEQIAVDAGAARLCFRETLGLSQDGMCTRERFIAEIASLISHEAETKEHGQRGTVAVEASAGAVWAALRHLIASGRRNEIPRLAPMLTSIALAPVECAEA